ncbi:MAG: electron transport complex subunit RsxB, partial [Nitrosospira sp.]|nr:electron transport complex subunit RsxB [Nitrosospira sp.]
TVIAAECTGCELCIAPCPVDCISMVPSTKQAGSAGLNPCAPIDDPLTHEDQNKQAADRARARYRFRLQRLEREKQEQEERLAQKTAAVKSVNVSSMAMASGDLKKVAIQAALERAMASRTGKK